MAVTLFSRNLRSLMAPRSVALVGASATPGSLGRLVLENLLAGGFEGELHAVNPGHRRVLGQKAHASLASIGASVDLAVIASPPHSVAGVIDEAGRLGIRAAVLITPPPPGDAHARRAWTLDVTRRAHEHQIRLTGPGAFGLIRTDIGLHASILSVPVARGRLALVAQSSAVCVALLDFAGPMGIGFSSVIELGNSVDLGLGDVLDYLMQDRGTDAIVLYVESVSDARRFLSALRTAARSKPVVVLRAGRSADSRDETGPAAAPDAVFEAAMRRSGTVRVHTYAQLFAAARILSMGRIPRGDRVAIVATGRGPALLAADSALDRGIRLATFADATRHALSKLLPGDASMRNPLDVHDDAPPERLAGALGIVLADDGVDAAIVMQVPQATIGMTDVARAVAAVGRTASKPVLAAWLGSIDRHEAREALEAGNIGNFYTPENAVEAFSFLAAYRRHQELLLEVPASHPEPERPDLAAAEAVRARCRSPKRTLLDRTQATHLLQVFGIAALPFAIVGDADAAVEAARAFGYPVSLDESATAPSRARADVRHGSLSDSRAVRRAWADLEEQARTRAGRHRAVKVGVHREPRGAVHLELSARLSTDAAFGPVIAVGGSRVRDFAAGEGALMLPPLNRRLAGDLIDRAGMPRMDATVQGTVRESILQLLLQLSSMAVALPWVHEVDLDPVFVTASGAVAGGLRVIIDPARAQTGDYGHLAIHPYPSELESEATARNGTRVRIRPIRPEDAVLEQRFVNQLSERTRYLRFFYQLHEITPAMLARFTQVDYDREIALVATVEDANVVEGIAFIGVARFISTGDGVSAEYAIVVDDAWQGQGIGRVLMSRLIDAARRKGLARLEGNVLRDNGGMLRFVASLGFSVRPDPEDPEQMMTSLELA